jgi:hypothetical protein
VSPVPRLLDSGGSGGISQAREAVDIVGVWDADGEQLFPLARPANGAVSEWASLAEHPVESGGTVADHRIVMPVEIEIAFYVTDTGNTFKRIQSAFHSRELLTVQTRAGIYENLAIVDMSHTETPDKADVIDVALSLKEVLLVKAQYHALPRAKVRKANDASTVDRGEQRPKQSVLAAGKDWVAGK